MPRGRSDSFLYYLLNAFVRSGIFQNNECVILENQVRYPVYKRRSKSGFDLFNRIQTYIFFYLCQPLFLFRCQPLFTLHFVDKSPSLLKNFTLCLAHDLEQNLFSFFGSLFEVLGIIIHAPPPAISENFNIIFYALITFHKNALI